MTTWRKRLFHACAFSAAVPAVDIAVIRDRLASLRQAFSLRWQTQSGIAEARVLLLASKADHLPHRFAVFGGGIGELSMQLVGIFPITPGVVEYPAADDVPYYHLPVTADTKIDRKRNMRIVEESGATSWSLARYMQILSGKLCVYLAGRCIKIPQFVPARLQRGPNRIRSAFEHGSK